MHNGTSERDEDQHQDHKITTWSRWHSSVKLQAHWLPPARAAGEILPLLQPPVLAGRGSFLAAVEPPAQGSVGLQA